MLQGRLLRHIIPTAPTALDWLCKLGIAFCASMLSSSHPLFGRELVFPQWFVILVGKGELCFARKRSRRILTIGFVRW